MNKSTCIISGSECPACNEDILQYHYEQYPHSTEHLECPNCNSTFTINYKQMYTEDVQNISGDMLDIMLEKFEERGMCISTKKEDELYDALNDLVEQFSTGDYRNHL